MKTKTLTLLEKMTGLGPFTKTGDAYHPVGVEPRLGGTATEILYTHGERELTLADIEHFGEEELDVNLLLFVSRHPATTEQKQLAFKAGLLLMEVGDIDAYSDELKDLVYRVMDKMTWTPTVAVVHPVAALRLLVDQFPVAVFKNENRDGEFLTTRMDVFWDNHETYVLDHLQKE